MQGGIRPGYKQTEVGGIPQEWDVVRIVDVAAITTGSRNTQDRIDTGLYPFFVRSQTVERINSYSFDGEAVLTAGDGVGTGKIFHYINGKFDLHQRVYQISNFSPRLNGFFFYLYFASKFFDRIMTMTAKSSVDSVRREMIADMLMPLPPPAEQRAIAAALADADALIAALEGMIAKKRDLKQAAMQHLLTGKTRLPGFSGEWEVKRLGDVASIKTGKRNNQDKQEDGEFPFFVRSETVERINSYSHDCEAILVPGEGNIGSIFHYIVGKFDVHQRVYAITNFVAGISGKFVHLWMRMNFGAHAMQNTVKATVDSLRLPTFQNFELMFPPTFEEQTAIAEVLSDMDADLAALEAQAAKARAVKQGMMQELLTGRVRLV